MMDPETFARSQQLLNEARMLSNVSASEPGPVGRGHQSSGPPAGIVFLDSGAVTHGVSVLEQCGEWINLAISHGSDDELRLANSRCERSIGKVKHGTYAAPETTAQFHLRLATAYDGVQAAKVAARERTSVTTVRNARIEHGRNPRDAKRVPKAMREGG